MIVLAKSVESDRISISSEPNIIGDLTNPHMASHRGKSTSDKDLELLGPRFQIIQRLEVDYERLVNDQDVEEGCGQK